jgi:hypothetical protein
MIRRKKDEVLKELPEKIRQTILLPSNKYKNEMKKEKTTHAQGPEEHDFRQRGCREQMRSTRCKHRRRRGTACSALSATTLPPLVES